MKLDRLLGITIYLLNHEKTSASTLAKRFEVSVRTIQRDIEALCMAGIPVAASMGADGGYEIRIPSAWNARPQSRRIISILWRRCRACSLHMRKRRPKIRLKK